ncbi:unnamed protein product [Chironomus riparius]|uniref:BTB domain-containing protein n=1 Tax=Chironomus riparius TaxID=315576 RepID=A0A9N9WYL8_9DIPT|nr:unnamed protein product [Chironomus riparius]
MKIKAEYQVASYQDRTLYECYIINNPNNELKNIKIQGQHVAGKNRLDVAAVKFDGCQLTKIPKNLTKIFPNLKFLIIWNSILQKLTKQDLAEYKELEVIDIRYSLLSSLSGDIFEGFKDIKIIYFVGEELQSIEPNIFDGLLSLEMAWLAFIGNLEIYKKGSQSYKEFRQDLSVRFYSSGAGHVESYVKKLEQKVKKFKKIKEDLSGKVYRLEAIQEDLINKNDELKEEKAEMSSTSDFFISFYKDELRSLHRKINKFEEGMLSDLKELIQDEATKDFKIIIGSHEFPVHKILLAIRSPVLAEILKSNPAIKSL